MPLGIGECSRSKFHEPLVCGDPGPGERWTADERERKETLVLSCGRSDSSKDAERRRRKIFFFLILSLLFFSSLSLNCLLFSLQITGHFFFIFCEEY